MLRVAVIGANGFVGSRLVEQWHLEERADVVPIVRRPEAAASVLRFGLDCRVADALDERGLARALAGCDAVVHAGAGPRPFVTQSPARVVRAAARAGAGTVIYLSSMAVHGWNPRPGTDEATPLPRRHPVPYNRWKARGERALRSACRETGTRFVILRPGIVYGPRSQWIDALRARPSSTAARTSSPAAAASATRSTSTTSSMRSTSRSSGRRRRARPSSSPTTMRSPGGCSTSRSAGRSGARGTRSPTSRRASPRLTPAERLLALKDDPAARVVLDRVPRTLRDPDPPPGRPSARQRSRSQGVSRQARARDSILQTCGYRFPTTKARRLLGFEPPISFDEASRRTVAWLGFAGYPVAAAAQEVA